MSEEELKNKQIFAVVDCNNFFVSCERVFNPKLHNVPVMVLSNNDGCVVARSNEVKDLGVPMGVPIHEVMHLVRKHNIKVFSSNFALYSDMSQRIMQVLQEFSPEMEMYSIDEAFLSLKDLALDNYESYCRTLRKTILSWTGIPVSIGIASTKTLGKFAGKISKKGNYEGVLDLTKLSESEVDDMLENTPVVTIWGVGRKTSEKLTAQGIINAKQLKYADTTMIRKYFGVLGVRTVLELRGVSCMRLETVRDMQKGIMCTRGFGKPVFELKELEEAVSLYAARASEKLRSQQAAASYVSVYITTSRHAKGKEKYFNVITLPCARPTSFTPTITSHALIGLRRIYKKGFTYKKAGVILGGLQPDNYESMDLWEVREPYAGSWQESMMNTVDKINRKYGKSTIHLASEGTKYRWRMKQENLSSRFTTSWEELLTITC